jgi:hypothetical protein
MCQAVRHRNRGNGGFGHDDVFELDSDSSLLVTVLLKTLEETLVALRTAVGLATQLKTKITLMATEVVRIQFALDKLLVSVLGIRGEGVSIQIWLCRDRKKGLREVLRQRSVVVTGGSTRRGFLKKKTKVKHWLGRLGHYVVLVEAEAKSCSTTDLHSAWRCAIYRTFEKTRSERNAEVNLAFWLPAIQKSFRESLRTVYDFLMFQGYPALWMSAFWTSIEKVPYDDSSCHDAWSSSHVLPVCAGAVLARGDRSSASAQRGPRRSRDTSQSLCEKRLSHSGPLEQSRMERTQNRFSDATVLTGSENANHHRAAAKAISGWPRSEALHSTRSRIGVAEMRDLIFVGCTIVFFVVAVAYVWACERLK